jgi:hypothetical protein
MDRGRARVRTSLLCPDYKREYTDKPKNPSVAGLTTMQRMGGPKGLIGQLVLRDIRFKLRLDFDRRVSGNGQRLFERDLQDFVH